MNDTYNFITNSYQKHTNQYENINLNVILNVEYWLHWFRLVSLNSVDITKDRVNKHD